MMQFSLFDRPKPHTRNGRLLALLEQRPVCSYEMYTNPQVTHRLAARIHDLRQMGYRIETSKCRVHPHESPAVLYRLEGL